MQTKTHQPIVVLYLFAVIGLSTPAQADTILNIDFVSTDLVSTASNSDVLQGNVTIDETTGTITGITNDFDGCCGLPDPNLQFSDLNGGNPLFNVGDSATATAIPGTSQVISDSTTGVTLNWTSVSSNSFVCSACLGGAYYSVSYNGTGPGGGPNTLEVGGSVEGNFLPGDFVIEMEGTVTSPPPPTSSPEPTSLVLFGSALIGFGVTRGKRKAA